MMVQKKGCGKGCGRFWSIPQFQYLPPKWLWFTIAFARPPTWSEKGGGKVGGFPEHWLNLIMLYMSSATLLMSLFLTNFALNHQDLYKSGPTPFRPPFPGTKSSKNVHTCLSLGSNGLFIELLHTFLAWNAYPHMKISWSWQILTIGGGKKLHFFATFFNLKQCAVKYEPDELWG